MVGSVQIKTDFESHIPEHCCSKMVKVKKKVILRLPDWYGGPTAHEGRGPYERDSPPVLESQKLNQL